MASSGPSPRSNSPIPLRRRFQQTLRGVRAACQFASLPALVLFHGFSSPPVGTPLLHDLLFPCLAFVLTLIPVLEWRLSLNRRGYLREHRGRAGFVIGSIWLALLSLAVPESWLGMWTGLESRGAVFRAVCELSVFVWGLEGLMALFGRVNSARWNAASIVLVTFLTVCLAGALLLMLPACQASRQGGDFLTCLFTSTSAVCVTGLNVVDPGTHWSRQGQFVILGLIQVGGLGIMTFGAFFALAIGRGLDTHEAFVVGDLLERNIRSDVNRTVVGIVVFTFSFEFLGAVLLWTLWTDLPPGERLFFSIFHAVSAFCNAGFGLLPRNFEGYGALWQIWGVLAWLIILGGIGFPVMLELLDAARDRLTHWKVNYLSASGERRPRIRLGLSSRLALKMSGALLLIGTLVIWVMERERSFAAMDPGEQAAAAWFQSVTCRTAGFNTVDIGGLGDATKFFMIFLMGIGASPGSCGGGLKTVPFAVILLALRAVLRGRPQVEVGRRTIPLALVQRALLIAALGILLTSCLTLLVVAFEEKPGNFLDYLFEVVSGLATVGLSTGITGQLTDGSRCVIITAMFLGRVGPLTLLVALAGRGRKGDIRYVEERVLLG